MADINGNNSANTLDGTTGTDQIFGFGDNDTLNGLAGDDRLFGGLGADILNGGAGTDTARYDADSALAGITVSLDGSLTATGAAIGDMFIDIESLTGTATFDDRLAGNQFANSLSGFGGADVLSGRAGNDSLFGGDGFDTLNGDEGNDDLLGGVGDDGLNGGTGADRLFGGDGGDTLNGEAGDDSLEGGAGADTLDGGDGIDIANYANEASAISLALDNSFAKAGLAADDQLVSIESIYGSKAGDRLAGDANANVIAGFDGNDMLNGRAGNDQLYGDVGNDTISGEDGNDTLSGGAGTDSIAGGNGGDSLQGGNESDWLWGNAGDDFLIGGAGADTIDGGVGFDTLSYFDETTGVMIALDKSFANGGAAAGEKVSNVEAISGSNKAADRITGSNGNNTLFGNAGNDVLAGQGGADTITGGAGGDAMFGGAGIDLVSYFSDQAVRVALDGSFKMGGAALGDKIAGFENLSGSNTGADTLAGNSGANTLYGNGGNDWIYGRMGGDVMIGGAGRDTMSGGAGLDQFYFFRPSEGGDRITDFQQGEILVFESSAFSLGNKNGFLTANNFTYGNQAGDDNDLFIFNRTTDQLWFDADGNGAGAAVLMATLNNFDLSFEQIYII